jgi:hypothetical protein
MKADDKSGYIYIYIPKLFKPHNSKRRKVKKGIKDFGVKYKELSNAISGVIFDFKQMRQTVIMWKRNRE